MFSLSYIIWYGAPPAILKKNSPYDKVRTPEALRSFNNFRNNSNKYVESILSNSGLNYKFINPFLDIFTFNEGQAYSCNNCDGVHVPEYIAKDKYTSVVWKNPIPGGFYYSPVYGGSIGLWFPSASFDTYT